MTNTDSVAVLRELLKFMRARSAGPAPYYKPSGMAWEQVSQAADMLAEVLAALSAQGEAVAHRWKRDGEVVGGWIDGAPSDRQFAVAETCKHMATWTVEYAYLHPAPPGSDAVTEDALIDLFDEVYEREWERAAEEADDRAKAIMGPADRHATRMALRAALASRTGKGEANV